MDCNSNKGYQDTSDFARLNTGHEHKAWSILLTLDTSGGNCYLY